MKRLLYNIASLTLSIKGKSIENFDKYINSYSNFQIDDVDDVDVDFNLGYDLDKRGFESIFFDDEGIVTFEQYKNTSNGETMVRASFRGLEHYLILSKDFSRSYTDILLDSPISAYLLDRFILISFVCRAIDFDILKMHASSINKDGKAIAFIGVSGTGKSTHSRLWLEHVEGSSLLNDDEPFVRVLDNGDILLYGAPWSGSTACFKNECYPLKSIVHLFQAKENKLTKLSVLDSVKSLMTSFSSLPMYDNMKMKQINLLYKILDRIPVYKLECLPNCGAVEKTRKTLEDDL